MLSAKVPEAVWLSPQMPTRRIWPFIAGMAAEAAPERPGFCTNGALEDAFIAVWSGKADNDRFNRLVLTAGATWREARRYRDFSWLLACGACSLPALAWLGWLHWQGTANFLDGHPGSDWLLVFGGVVTAVPLILYANGAKLLRLSTIGIMQYIAPSMIFITAVFVFHEPFSTAKAIAFPLIWAALVIYTLPMLRQR